MNFDNNDFNSDGGRRGQGHDDSNRRYQDIRLDRIEQKLDKLSDIVISMARAEEKLITLETDRNDIIIRLKDINTKLSSLEKHVDENKMTIQFVTRLFWILTSVIATAVASQFLIK